MLAKAVRFHAGLLSGQRFRGSDLVANGRVCFVDNVVDWLICFTQLRPKVFSERALRCYVVLFVLLEIICLCLLINFLKPGILLYKMIPSSQTRSCPLPMQYTIVAPHCRLLVSAESSWNQLPSTTCRWTTGISGICRATVGPIRPRPDSVLDNLITTRLIRSKLTAGKQHRFQR